MQVPCVPEAPHCARHTGIQGVLLRNALFARAYPFGWLHCALPSLRLSSLHFCYCVRLSTKSGDRGRKHVHTNKHDPMVCREVKKFSGCMRIS